MTSRLFSPITMRGLEVPNRIVVAPMCQYSAHEGLPNDWHLMHLGQFAVSGTGLVFVEATGVEAEGRITPGCVGLYNDAQQEMFSRIVRFFRDYGSAKIGMQLAHAGRKASADVPWRGGKPLSPADGGWQTVAPSAIPYGDGWHTPEAFGDNSLARVRTAFVDATRRARDIGFDAIELH
ncbi:MAG: oxidoreductase, partial [Pseudomonadota bacterium]